MEIQEIIHRLKKQDKQALSYLFDVYAASLNGIILRILPTKKLAEEALQQTFLNIWDTIEQYDESKLTFFTWMSQIARNNAIKNKHQLAEQDLQNAKTLHTKGNNLKSIKSDYNSKTSENLMEKLGEEHRMIINYVYLQGYSLFQTALVLQIPQDKITIRLRLALVELREILRDENLQFFGALSIIMIIITYLCQ